MNVLRVVGEENSVNSVEEGFGTWNVETLGDVEIGDVLRQSLALS